MTDLATHAHDLSHHTSTHQLAYLELPASGSLDQLTTSTTAIVGATMSVPGGDPRPYEVIFGAHLYTDAVNQTVSLILREDGVEIGGAIFSNFIAAFATRTVRSRRRRLPALTSHTYTLAVRTFIGGSNVHALGYATAGPIFMEALTL